VQRARIVLYASEGMADTEIAGRLDTTAGIVGKWRRRFFHDRLEGLKDKPRAGCPRRFHAQQVAEVKAVACELPATSGLPLSKFSRVELHRLVVQRGVTDASASTIWRRLHGDAIKPWQTRSWISARPRLCGEGRPDARPLRQNL
jgi:transposase